MSSVNKELGNMHVVYGTVIYSGATTAALTCNDGSAVLTTPTTGDALITFGSAFRTAPHVAITRIDKANVATTTHTVQMLAPTTTVLDFDFSTIASPGATGTCDVTSPDPASGDGFSFIAMGERDN